MINQWIKTDKEMCICKIIKSNVEMINQLKPQKKTTKQLFGSGEKSRSCENIFRSRKNNHPNLIQLI